MWFDLIKIELTAYTYDDVLENPVKENGSILFDVDAEAIKQKIRFVKSYIISIVDNVFKAQIHELETPFNIVKRLHDSFNSDVWSNIISLEQTVQHENT